MSWGHKFATAWGLAALAAVSAGAAARADVPGDTRCLLVMAAAASQPQSAAAGQTGVIYFTGRIKGQDPGYDLAGHLKTAAHQMTPAILKAEAPRCSAMLEASIKELQAAQQSINPAKPKPAHP